MMENQQENKNNDIKNSPFIRRLLRKSYIRIIIGIIAGIIIGALYWEFIGCQGGSCPLTSNPTKTMILFGLMGGWFTYRK